jgi:Recombination enhancement, RecA-dependent nuclease
VIGPHKKPTKAEKVRMDVIAQMFCPCCRQLGLNHVVIPPVEIHHMLRGGKRMGHWYTIPICPGHHRGAWTEHQKRDILPGERVSLASGRPRFEAVYGTERAMWTHIQNSHGWDAAWPQDKIVRRKVA